MATPDELLAIVRRGYEAGWNRGDMGILDDLLAPDSRTYDPTVPGGVVTWAAVRDFLQQIRAAYPDVRREVSDDLAQDDKIAVRWIADGKIAEEWLEMDSAGLAGQLTAVG